MKTCPNCKAEMEDNFDICWQCNFSISVNKVMEFEETSVNSKQINCLRCNVPMAFSGNYKFHEGTKFGFFGNLLEVFVNRKSFDLYICPECGKVEFFSLQS